MLVPSSNSNRGIGKVCKLNSLNRRTFLTILWKDHRNLDMKNLKHSRNLCCNSDIFVDLYIHCIVLHIFDRFA